MNDNDWINDPSLKNINPSKLQALLSMTEQGQGIQQKELLPFLMAAASKSKSAGTSFSSEETSLILDVLKQGKTPEEIARIEKMCALVNMMKRR